MRILVALHQYCGRTWLYAYIATEEKCRIGNDFANMSTFMYFMYTYKFYNEFKAFRKLKSDSDSSY